MVKLLSSAFVVAIVMSILSTNSFAAESDEAPPDKSGYTLFNPVPEPLLRDFSSDRPTKGSSATTVDAGHFQYESDLASWSYDRYNSAGTKSTSLAVFDAVLKAGLSNNVDLELALAPFNFSNVHDYTAQTKSSAYGSGDVSARLKYNLIGNDSGDYALAVVPYIKAPTAEHDLGNGYWEGGFYVPFSANLFDGWTLGALTELDIQENAALDGTHPNYQNLVNLNHSMFSKNITGSVEFWSDVNTDAGASPQYTTDLSIAWLANENLQLDSGVNIGLNKAAPDLQLYAGISQRF